MAERRLEKLNNENGTQPAKRAFVITEKRRTVLLILLLAFAIGFIYWTKNSYSSNFVDGF